MTKLSLVGTVALRPARVSRQVLHHQRRHQRHQLEMWLEQVPVLVAGGFLGVALSGHRKHAAQHHRESVAHVSPENAHDITKDDNINGAAKIMGR